MGGGLPFIDLIKQSFAVFKASIANYIIIMFLTLLMWLPVGMLLNFLEQRNMFEIRILFGVLTLPVTA